MTLVWPERVLAPRSFQTPRLDGVTVSGGRSALTNKEAVIPADTGFWRLSLAGIPLTTKQQQLCWNAIAGLLHGRANGICVPLGVWTTAPWAMQANGRRQRRRLPWAGPVLWAGDLYWQRPAIVATIRAAALRATTVTIDLFEGADIEPGHIFGLGGNRAHKIKTVSKSGSAYTCTITPPLRAAVTAGSAVDFENPRVECVLESDMEMSAEFDLARFAEASVNFVERW
jgi:hypothetical protein